MEDELTLLQPSTVVEDNVEVDSSMEERLRNSKPLGSEPDEGSSAGSEIPSGNRDHIIVDNFTCGQARIMVGDIGVEKWEKSAGTSSIRGNVFKSDLRIMAGDVGLEAAASFNENFWK